jgi:hypothetical protein
MPSLQEVNKYSNYDKAKRQTSKFLGKNAKLYLSTRKNKKFMVIDPETGHKIHFGLLGYQDYLKHKNKTRRHNFLVRNHKWKNAKKYSPAYLAYHILW